MHVRVVCYFIKTQYLKKWGRQCDVVMNLSLCDVPWTLTFNGMASSVQPVTSDHFSVML